MKKLGHAIEDWVAGQSPFGNSSIIDAQAFEWVERLEENSEVIRQELIASLSGQAYLPNIQELSPRQMNLSKADGWKTYFFFLLGHRIEESYKRCPETGKLLDSIPGMTLAFFSVLANAHQAPSRVLQRCRQVSSWLDRTGAADSCPYAGR
jgi:beta-hydroxylase